MEAEPRPKDTPSNLFAIASSDMEASRAVERGTLDMIPTDHLRSRAWTTFVFLGPYHGVDSSVAMRVTLYGFCKIDSSTRNGTSLLLAYRYFIIAQREQCMSINIHLIVQASKVGGGYPSAPATPPGTRAIVCINLGGDISAYSYPISISEQKTATKHFRNSPTP